MLIACSGPEALMIQTILELLHHVRACTLVRLRGFFTVADVLWCVGLGVEGCEGWGVCVAGWVVVGGFSKVGQGTRVGSG